MGMECAKGVSSAHDSSFDVPAVHGNWKGTLSADGNTLSGVWSQDSPLPLNLTRQSVAMAAAPIPVPTYDPALAPVAAADLQSVLDRDLAEVKSTQIGSSSLTCDWLGRGPPARITEVRSQKTSVTNVEPMKVVASPLYRGDFLSRNIAESGVRAYRDSGSSKNLLANPMTTRKS
jgi:hypothetical protein